MVSEDRAPALDVSEAIDLAPVTIAQRGVTDAESLARCKTQYPDFALMQIAVDVEGRLTRVLEAVTARECGVDHALLDQPVRLPGLAVVGEVRADDPLQVHPQVPVVVLVVEAARRGAGDDRAAAAGHVHRGAEGLPARVLEHDVRVLAVGQLPDPGAETLPLLGILGLRVGPELVALGAAVDDQL